jgi:CheY-like chemotaxis protein
VQSQPSEGSTFSVRLLLPSQEVDNDADLHSEIIGYQGRRRQIMVVDDQYDHRALLLGLLEPLGFYLSEAGSGEECLQKAPDIMPDLLLMDISMTGMDGIETVIRLRELKMQMPILVLSANAYPGDQETAIIAGCNDFLAKPLRVAELLSKLKQHLNLTWQYKQPALFTPSPSAPLQPMKIPSPTLLEPCLQLVRIGDLIGLQKYLTTLKEEHTDYTEFFCRLSELSSEFRLGEIRNLLNLSSSQESL